MNRYSKQIFISMTLIIFGFVVVYALSNFLEKNRLALPEGYEDSDLILQGAKLKKYAPGFNGLLADWYWMKSLQYIGDKVSNGTEAINLENLKPLNPRLLYPYLNTATDLDPQFMSVYEFGATVLPAIDKEQAIKFTEKGIKDNPNEWRLYNYLGYIYWRMGNFEKASEVYADGAKIEGAPDWMRLMTARMKTEGGSRATARAIYEQIFEEAQDTQSKENAALWLLELDSLDEQEAIQKVLDDFRLKNNRCANNWKEVFPALQTLRVKGRALSFNQDGMPTDPTGIPYIIFADDGKCEIDVDWKNSKIPRK